MKIKISDKEKIETDDLTDDQLLQSHAYYYQLGLREVAGAFHDALKKRQTPKEKEVERVDEDQ